MSAKLKILTFESTGLLPVVVAADVLRELGVTDETLIDYVEQRTQDVYRNNERFRKGLSSTDPRAWYRMWVKHWIAGEHNRREKRRLAITTNLNGVNTMIEIAVFAIFLYQLYKRLRVNPRFID
jgi:hypothetical protein